MVTKEIQDAAQVAFIRARINLLGTRPFYAHLCMKMPLQWIEFAQPDGEAGVSATDGHNLFINPERFVALGRDEQVSVLIHEVLHCAAGHLFRVGSRDPVRWNIAGDVYIANLIEAEKFKPLQGAEAFLTSMGIDRAKFAAMNTEKIYENLPASCSQQGMSGQDGQSSGSPKPGNGTGKAQGGCKHWNGSGCYREPATSQERSQGEQEWKQAVIEAGQQAGSATGAWSELVKAAMPKPPFHLKLFEYLSRGFGGDTSFDSFNRRYLWQGLYLPCDTKQVMGEIAVAVDTSGSMSNEQLALAFGYIRAFREQHPCKLHLIQCDYDSVGEGQYKLYDDWEPLPSEFKAVGRGGTSFDPPFKLMREKRIDPKVMIYLTDGYGYCGEKSPHYPTLWVVLKGDAGFKPPFGDVVVVK